MKTRTLLPMFLAFALTVGAALSPVACVAGQPPVARHPVVLDRGEGQAFSITGRVESVDYDSNVIVVRSKGEVLTIAITPTTSLERDGEIGSIADLRPGVRVRLKGSVRDGVKTAESIVILK